MFSKKEQKDLEDFQKKAKSTLEKLNREFLEAKSQVILLDLTYELGFASEDQKVLAAFYTFKCDRLKIRKFETVIKYGFEYSDNRDKKQLKAAKNFGLMLENITYPLCNWISYLEWMKSSNFRVLTEHAQTKETYKKHLKDLTEDLEDQFWKWATDQKWSFQLGGETPFLKTVPTDKTHPLYYYFKNVPIDTVYSDNIQVSYLEGCIIFSTTPEEKLFDFIKKFQLKIINPEFATKSFDIRQKSIDGQQEKLNQLRLKATEALKHL